MNQVLQLFITNRKVAKWLIVALLSAVAAITLEPVKLLHDAAHQVQGVPLHKQ